MLRLVLAVSLIVLSAVSAFAQSSPGFRQGQVLTADQWNAAFIAKQDYLGFAPLSPSSFIGTAPISTSSGIGTVTISLAACSASGQILFFTSSIWACSAQPILGLAGGTGGTLTLAGSTSGSATISVTAATSVLNLGSTNLQIDTGGNLLGVVLQAPIMLGGSAVGSTLALRSTSATGTTDAILFQVGANGATESFRSVTGGQIVKGHTAAITSNSITPTIQINTLSGSTQLAQQTWSNDTAGSLIALSKSRGTTPGSFTIVQSGDSVGTLVWRAADGTQLANLASISAQVDGTPGSGDMPGRITFNVSQDGVATSTERVRISNTGHTNWTGTAPALTSCGTSPAITGNDMHGTVTMGTAAPTGCVITFALAYAAAPSCRVTWRTNIASMQYTVSTTAITLTQTATSSNLIDYNCWGT